jgi:hypothetical protein
MPIKPENLKRYPANWKEIRAGILARAGNCCEWQGCAVANHLVGYWLGIPSKFVTVAGASAGALLDIAHPEDGFVMNVKMTKIVLTIAHLDHTPENNDPSNLMAMCQRHHLAYDQKHHAVNSYMTRKAKAQTRELAL